MKCLEFAAVIGFVSLSAEISNATTLAPELKAYDFAQAYYVEDGGVVLVPYQHGFVCHDGIETPEGIRIMPGGSFMQYDSTRMVADEYILIRLNPEGTRAFFHQRAYSYQVTKDDKGKFHTIRGPLLGTADFYLSLFRQWEWLDFALPYTEAHPGAQLWRTRVPTGIPRMGTP
jgi:hypothetical protein